MPVYIRPDEETPVDSPQVDDGEHRALMRQAALNALRTGVNCVVLAALAMALALRGLRSAILAADRLMDGSGDYWQEMWMPAVLFGFFGLAFGGFTAWRMTAAASTGGTTLYVMGSVAAVLLALLGAVAVTMIFSGAVPTMAWIVLSVMTAAAVAGVCLFAAWTD